MTRTRRFFLLLLTAAGWSAVAACSGSSDGTTATTASGTTPTADAAALTCDGPQGCAGGVCCATVMTGPGTAPNCSIASASSVCAAACNTVLPLTTCGVTASLRLCHAASDCAGEASGATSCCDRVQDGTSLTFCLQPAYSQGLVCHE